MNDPWVWSTWIGFATTLSLFGCWWAANRQVRRVMAAWHESSAQWEAICAVWQQAYRSGRVIPDDRWEALVESWERTYPSDGA